MRTTRVVPCIAVVVLAACAAPDQLLVGEAARDFIVSPSPIPLVAGDPCGVTEVTLWGTGTLYGAAFLAESGDPASVVVPERRATFRNTYDFKIAFCPTDEEPVEGWLLLSLEPDGAVVVRAEEG